VCADGEDNDGDGLIDYPNDPGCADSSDGDETNAAPPPPSGRVRFESTDPAGTLGLPRSLDFCAAHIVLDPFDPHDNSSYNVPRDDLSTGWSDPRFGWWASFPTWTSVRRAQIDDRYASSDGSTLTTTEIFSFAACRWGVREDLLRAVAVQESDWHEHNGPGDTCSGYPDANQGHGSYGIMQVKNFNCSNEGDWGGFPRTWYSAPFNVDLYGAAFRACLEQAFWYLIPSGDNGTRRERGCVGAWFSGSYNPDISYTNSVYIHLANRDWQHY
jgi:hypothetical protein